MSYKGFIIRYRTHDGNEHMAISDRENLMSRLDMILSRSGIEKVQLEPKATKMEAIEALAR